MPLALDPAEPMAPRLWMGVRSDAYTPDAFKSKLGDVFIPATAALMRPLGLQAYAPALLPLDKPLGLPDEMALVVYPSVSAYKAAMSTPVGSIYGSAHRDLFARNSESVAVLKHDGLADTVSKYLAELPIGEAPDWSASVVVSLAVQMPQALPDTWRGPWSACAAQVLSPDAALAHYAYRPQGAAFICAWWVLSQQAAAAWALNAERLVQAVQQHFGQAPLWHWMSPARPVVPSLQAWEPRQALPLDWGESLQMRWPG